MLSTAAAAASGSSRLLPPFRTEGGAGAPPRICPAKLGALTTLPRRSASSTFNCACSPSPSPGDKDGARVLFDEYSVLSPDIPWEVEDIWRTFSAYFFILHIPLSFGGLDLVAKVLHCPSLDPLTTVASTVMLQLAELTLALALLQYTAKPHHEVQTFFAGKLPSQRSWIKETVLGLGILMTLVSLTSFIADKLIGPEDAYNPILKGILSDSPTSRLVCFFLYCVIAPLSEETIYRGFLLTALSSSMKLRDAVIEIMENYSSDVQMSHCAEESETTIEIKIKTLDSQTYNLRVNKCVPVPLLKEKIATVTGILSEQQRLICRGRVLKDDELLSAYHVEDGHTLHRVVRQPGQSASSGNAGNEATTTNSAHHVPTMARSIVLEAVNVDQGSEFPGIGQILQGLFGIPIGTHASGGPAPSDTRPSEPTQSSIPNAVRVELDQHQAPMLFQSEAALGSSQPNVIPDSLTTISQYIDFMRDLFRREGFNGNGQTVGNVDHRTAGSAHVGGTQNQESEPDSATPQHGLPTAALLAEAMHSTRQLVHEQAGVLLSQLSTQLGDLVNVTDSATRRNLQHSAMRYGVLLQNLGALLLELGRTTMMIRINPVPSEAVVNSGPALFISPSGPNPLMVPPAPVFPGTRSVQMGPIFSSLSSQGAVLHPRDVDIHVRTSGSVPVASTNPSEPVGAQQAQESTDRIGNASHANISEAFAGVSGGAPPGVRLLPLRTVVTVPAGISRAPSGSSSGGVGVIYPLLTRIQQRANTNGNDARNGQSPNEPARSGTHANHQPNPQSSQAPEAGNLGSPIEVNVANSSQTSPGQHNSQGPFSQLMDSLQWIGSLFSRENAPANGTSQHAPTASTGQVDARNHGTPEVSGVSDEGLRFANLVRQIMPFIAQVETQNRSTPAHSSSTPSQAVSESLNSAGDGTSDSRSSHQRTRDPDNGPNSKRQRMSD